MLEKLQRLEDRYVELENLLATQEVLSNQELCNRYAKELADLRQIVMEFRDFKRVATQIAEMETVLQEKHDKEFLDMAREELRQLRQRKEAAEPGLLLFLRGEDEDAGKDVIVEIRAGTGGMEAGLFAADLYRMYVKYAAKKGWQVESMSGHETELGGFKEIVFSVKGRDAYRRLKFESGVHRVQRVPETEAQGRIHTSTATVAVLAEAQEQELVIEPKDVKIDTYRSSGAGGQNVQKTDSAVRLTHLPTGTVVTCQDERSQLKNKTKAMRILRTRILDAKRQEDARKVTQARKSQIGSGDRSEKIRTYNYPDRRVTDHRINLTVHQLEAVLEGDLDEFSDALIQAENDEKMKQNE